jgi:chromosome segregation ATPase
MTHTVGANIVSSHALKIEDSAESNIRVLRDLHASLSELTRSRDLRSADQPRAERGGERSNDIVSQLETLVSLVENSQNVIDALVDTIRDHEAVIYDLKNRLSEEASQKEAAYQHAAKVEAVIRVEKERADVSEARAKTAEEEVKFLQGREAAIRERIERLTAGVSIIASAGQIKSPFMASGLTHPRGAPNHAA